MKQRYKVCKTFLEGVLKGLTIEEQTTVRFENGGTYGGCRTGSRYRSRGLTPSQNLTQVPVRKPSSPLSESRTPALLFFALEPKR